MSNTSLLGSFGGQAGDALMFRNKIINGDMRIDQRKAGAAFIPTNGQYTVDRFAYIGTQAGKIAAQQDISTFPQGFMNSLVAVSQSSYAITASDIFNYHQKIEGYNIADLDWGTANAKAVTLSFWARSSLTGVFGGSLIVGTGCYPFSYSLGTANTWTYVTVVIPPNTAYAPVSKTTGQGAYLSFGLGVGATNSAAAGSWTSGAYYSATGATSVVGTNGATFYLTGVQLEAGPTATPFERRPYSVELGMCERYYELGPSWELVRTNSSVSFSVQLKYRTPKRISLPTIRPGTGTYYVTSPASAWASGDNSSVSGVAVSSVYGTGASPFSLLTDWSSVTNVQIKGTGYQFMFTGGPFWTADAEL